MNIQELRNNITIAECMKQIKHTEYMIAEGDLTVLQNQYNKWEAEFILKSKMKEIEMDRLDGTN